jgi:dihydrofolate synthase/folylpolyglutamate synthase
VSRAAARIADGRPIDLVLGMLENKDADAVIARFAPIARSLTAVPVPGHPHHAPGDLARRARDAGLAASEAADLPAALAAIRPETGAPPVVLILGSLYLAGTALEANDELPD